MVAQLQPIDLVAPGFLGLNLAESANLLTPEYCTIASNCIIDQAGRLAVRNGYENRTMTAIAGNPAIKSLHEYLQQDGTLEDIVAWDGGIANDIVDPEGNDISGAVVDAEGRWDFQDFNNNCIGFQSGQVPIVYSGAGTFASVVPSSGTAPTGGIGLCAYGRVWSLDADGKTIKYSGLLDETIWGVPGNSGIIDMSAVWTGGTDLVTAIAAFNGALVVFGQNHIVFWVDGQGSAIGLDPENIYLSDVIEGTGCLSDLTVQNVGETDLLFLSRNGVQSLSRLLVQRSNPIQNLTKTVRDDFLRNVRAESVADIRSTYSPEEGFYLLTLPSQGQTWVLDQRRRYQDRDGDALSIITLWDLAPTSWNVLRNGQLLLGNTVGIGQYSSTTDNGTSYRFNYQSTWLNLGEDFGNRLKMLKRVGAILFVQNNTDIVFKWYVDFDENFRSLTTNVPADSGAEWGIGEWGIMDWSGGLSLRIIKLPARAKGQYFRLGIEAQVDGEFAIQQAELFTKIGRLA